MIGIYANTKQKVLPGTIWTEIQQAFLTARKKSHRRRFQGDLTDYRLMTLGLQAHCKTRYQTN